MFKRKTMRSTQVLLSTFALTVVVALSAAQEVPKGVTYKPTTEAVNSAAKSALEKALATDSAPQGFFDGATVCGPMLWKALKPDADRVMLGAKPVIATIQNPEIIVAEGKVVRTDDERQSFWRQLLSRYPTLKTARIRKAKAAEISYYWVTIPFDIEEPFFAIETNSEVFVAQLMYKEGKATLFWIDLVGDVRSLKP